MTWAYGWVIAFQTRWARRQGVQVAPLSTEVFKAWTEVAMLPAPSASGSPLFGEFQGRIPQ